MSMIEGIGDEVVQAFGICLVILIFVTAWKSTAIREIPQIRAVYIVGRRSQAATNNESTAVQAPPAPPDPGQDSSTSTQNDISQPTENKATHESDRCVNKQPSPSNNDINAYRLSYFSNLQNNNQTPSTSTAAEPNGMATSSESNTNSSGDNVPTTDDSQHSIRVKLKYLNDDQRIVTGNLKELLGQFKRRCFKVELDNNKNVLLIFQGRVLKEEETLEDIGMYDNCVVHCLVKNGRTTERNLSGSGATNSTTPAEWNLGPLLVAILTAVFVAIWFSYWAFPQIFDITATIFLACLTTVFVLSVISMYQPQLFQSL